MDNAYVHRNKIIKNYINDIGNQLHYSISYKPKTNALETWLVNSKQGKGLTFRHLNNIINCNRIK